MKTDNLLLQTNFKTIKLKRMKEKIYSRITRYGLHQIKDPSSRSHVEAGYASASNWTKSQNVTLSR